jgi:uncharacterized protein
MPTSETHVPTASGERYMTQLCKHWSHRFEVTLEPGRGRVSFGPDRACRFEASAEELRIRLEAADPDALARLEVVVLDHLHRFAFREDLGAVEWARSG